MTRTRRGLFRVVVAACVALAASTSCRRAPDVPPEVYREAVVAFHTALAAMDTSQEVLAREKLDRVVALVPQEPAGWANLGLLLLRQQELAPAKERLARAAELAPKSAAIVRLQALAESREGNLTEATRLWQRAVELAPADLKSAYALARETERQGGDAAEAEAQRVLAQLVGHADNLPARLDYARLAAKRGDAAALAQAIAPLTAAAESWPQPARERLEALRATAAANPRAAATHVAFLRNLLARDTAYRRALAQVTTPLDAIGEPITRFLILPTPPSTVAPADLAIAFAVVQNEGWPTGLTWAGAVTLTGEGAETVLAADATGVVGDAGRRIGATREPANDHRGATVVVPADLDYDYRTDLVIGGPGGLAFLRQQPDGGFVDVSRETGIPDDTLHAPVSAGWTADEDLDGDLDLVIAPSEGPIVVLRNNGDGTFTGQRPFDSCARTRGFEWADFDGEGVPDAACLDSSGALHIYLNLRGGAFDRTTLPGSPVPLAAIAAADVTGDGRADVVGLAASGEVIALSLEDPGEADAAASATWRWRTLARAGAGPATTTPEVSRLLVADLDNNAALDLVVSGPGTTRLLLAGPDGTFAAAGTPLPLDTHAVADLDEDGRLDLVGLTPERRLATARSTGTRSYHWQRLRPRAATATGDQRVNSFGIGGEVEVRTGLHVQTHPISTPIVHIGLGNAASSDVIRIIWPNGVLQSEFSQRADVTIRADQRLKGSCPWLFAWNGREMRFVTDLIWRSPLGLRINAQVTADASTTEDWVKVGGSQLAARDGAYDLRITAELWETHFFDLVSLAVVDHPAGTEVFVDERFAIPAPTLAPVVTGPLQPFTRVTDDTGRDASATVAVRDDQHLDFAGRGRYQGVTRQHAIELTVPETAPRDGPLYLVAQGWVHPTDSSINVAIAQGHHAPPRSLALEVADRDGHFRTVRTDLGFPSGKDKTVLIDIAGLLPAEGPRRLRLSTNLEIFWDRLAWAVGRPDVRVTPRRLTLASADLRYRGFSATIPHPASVPERPRYTIEGTAPRWLDLEGFHTRFGDVRPLLTAVDDRYVIMNAGDEIALRFPEAPPVAAGMVRDFIVVGDGWVKDGDFNTTFSRTVLPLPTHATGRYDRAPGPLERDPVYQQHLDDFATYHTRYVTPDARRALRAAAPRQPS